MKSGAEFFLVASCGSTPLRVLCAGANNACHAIMTQNAKTKVAIGLPCHAGVYQEIPMSDTAPHFIDSTQTDAQATLEKATDFASQGAATIETTAKDFSNRASDALQSGTAAASDTGKRALSSLVDINKTLTDAYSQSVSEMNALAQQAFQVRTAKDLIAFQSDVLTQFQRNLAAAANIYSAIWQTATQSVTAATDRVQETADNLRQAA
jgi:hypothetical protein